VSQAALDFGGTGSGGHAPPSRWFTHGDGWFCSSFPGVTIAHCGHPTALRPYYVSGLPITQKFSTLLNAQIAVSRFRK